MQFLKFYFTYFILFSQLAFSQKDTLKKVEFNAYGEIYYSYNFSNPQNHEKPNFLYNHKRHNELNANLILFQGKYTDTNYRANVGLMAGNYAQYNLISEPTWAQFIYEANIGINLSTKNSLWLDIGILPSHIGFESAINTNCWTLTRSLLAENSPYYETGARLSYTSKNEKIYLAIMYLNGWQKIMKNNSIQKPSFGSQITYQPKDKITLNYSTFIGYDKPDSINSLRFFNDFYLQYEPSNKFGVIAGLDIGSDKFNLNNYGTWYSPVLIMRYLINKKTRIALRGEYYNDSHQIIVQTNTNNGFKTIGLSTNFDFFFNDKITLRLEGKMFSSEDKIFSNKHENYSITTNLSIQL